MNGFNHLIIGASAGAMLGATTGDLAIIGASTFAGAIGGLIPDVDHINSKAGRRLLPVSIVVYSLFGHRTITHSGLFVLITVIIAMSVNHVVAFAAALGVVSHIVADALTPRGVPILYPLPIRFRFPLVWRLHAIIEPFVIVLIPLVAVFLFNEMM